jgi:hypothetical protein
MPGWSTVLRVDKAALGLDEVAPAPVVDEGTLHDGQEASPFDETTEPPAFAPVAPPAAPSVARSGIRAPPSRPSAAPASRAAPSARYDRPIETVAPEEYTQLDQPAPAELRSALADERTVDTSPADKGARPAGGVQVEGVVGERIPAVVVRRAPAPAPSPAPRGAEAGARGDRRLENAPVTAGGPRPSTSHAELTQINAAAALGIAPEPAAPPPSLGPARVVDDPGDRTPPPAVGRVDFGPLRLADKEEVLARYPVEAPGIGAAERLGEKAPLVRTVSKLLPVLFVAMIALSFVGVFLVGPLGDLLQAGQRQSAREALREAQLKSEASATADEGHTLPSGSIRVVTRPTRASIEVDGYYLGRSPMMIAPPEERPLYEFRISADGHRTWHGTLRFVGEGYVLERSEASESVGPGVLTPEGAQHRLSVELDPATP